MKNERKIKKEVYIEPRKMVCFQENGMIVKVNQKTVCFYANIFEELGKLETNFDIEGNINTYTDKKGNFLFVLGRSKLKVKFRAGDHN